MCPALAYLTTCGLGCRCVMSGALLATDQAAVAPLRGMQNTAYEMLAAKAYLHQYEKYGLQARELHECFAHVEDIIGCYSLL